MSIAQLIQESVQAGIYLYTDNGQLAYKLTGDEFPEQLKARIIENKAELVDFLLAYQSDDVSTERPELKKIDRTNKQLPTSFAQQRLWFIDQMDSNSAHYNICAALKVSGTFNLAVAEQTFKYIIERHEPLRTTFSKGKKEPVQVINQDFSFAIKMIDLSVNNTHEQDDILQKTIENEQVKLFDLAKDLMLKVSFIQVSAMEGILIYNMHHIAADGWSMGILMNEFVHLYQCYSSNKKPNLLPIKIQYVDYAVWQREWLENGLDKQIGYWKQQLDSLPQVHSLPTDFPRPLVPSFKGGHYEQILDKALTVGLADLASENGCTMFMVIHGIFSLLLSRYANESDVVIGTPVANRTQQELEPLVGFFVNTLVLRNQIPQSGSFCDYLKNIRAVNLAAQSNQDVPFELLVEKINPARSMSHAPLFQIMIAMNNNNETNVELSDIHFSSLKQSKESTAKFDLTLNVSEINNTLNFSVEYARDLFEHQTITQLMIHFSTLINHVVASPKSEMNQLSIFNSPQQKQLFAELTNDAHYADQSLIHELVEQQAIKTPHSVAVKIENNSLNYQDLNEKANQLAYYLREQGVSVNTTVGISIERSLDMMIALLAILKAGGGYVPIDPSYPEKRQEFMVKNSQVKLLITQQHLKEKLADNPIDLLIIDAENIAGVLHKYPSCNLPKLSTQAPENLAYIIYTSGSTGQPKGAMVSHANESNLLHWYRDEYQFSAADNILVMSATGFDLTQKNLWTPLITGASLHFATAQNYDVNLINSVIKNEKITITNCAPSVFYPLVEQINNYQKLSSLRCVLFGGEPIELSRLSPWLKSTTTSPAIVNMYGPTECTDIACAYTINEPLHFNEKVIPIGRPNAGVQLYILNNHSQLVPVGSPGELCISGAGVGLGYFNAKELTEKAFIKNPFTSEGHELLYKTGDLVRFNKSTTDENGAIEFIGRIDNQVKMRGFRIELGEIESQLLECPFVKSAVVIVREDQPGNQQLVAYIIAEHNMNESIETWQLTLRGLLSKELPDYMVPNAFVMLDEFTLTPNGKVDRKALPIPEQKTSHHTHIPAANEQESTMANIWSQLLNVSELSVVDNFFELGGHSLLITQLIHQVHQELGFQILVKDVFNNPTVRALTILVNEQPTSNLAIVPVKNTAEHPLSYAQYRIWIIENLKENTNAHNMPIGAKLRGNVCVSSLEKSLQVLVAHHAILRTKIIDTAGEPKQVCESALNFTLKYHDLSNHDEAFHQCQLVLNEHDTHKFVLSQLPLFSALLVKLSTDEYRLHLNFHHIISDGWSLNIFFSQLIRCYEAITKGQVPQLENTDINYIDYAHWQHNWLNLEEAEKQRNFWQEYLHGNNQQFTLPTQEVETLGIVSNSMPVSQTIDSDITDKLKVLGHQHKGSLFNVLHSALALLLARLSGETDLNIGIPVTGRNIPGTEALLGLFLNNLPVRTVVDFDLSFSEYLSQEISNITQVLSNQDLPFEQILEASNANRNLNSTPLFQVFLNMLSLPDHQEITSEVDISLNEISTLENKFNLTLYVAETSEGLALNCHFNSSLFSREAIDIILSQFNVLLTQIADKSELPCGEYGLTLASDVHCEDDIQRFWPGAVHELFSQQATLDGEKVAISELDRDWSYQQVNSSVQSLAFKLQEQGVKSGDTVAIIAQRNAHMVIAMLATLQAGAAFSLLNASYPAERIKVQLDILDPEIILAIGEEHEFPETLKELITGNFLTLYLNTTSPYFTDTESLATPVLVKPEQMACITFTSGSSGIPKAVAGSHIGLSGYFCWLPQTLSLEKNARYAMLSGVIHDPIQRDVFGALCTGGQLIIPEEADFEPFKLASWINENQVEVAHLTPAMIEILCTTDENSLATLKVIFSTGERLHFDTVAALKQLNQEMKVLNSYGSTESQRAVTYFDSQDVTHGMIPSQRNAPDTRLTILTEQGRLCGVGEIAEICIESYHLSLGYLNDPVLTTQKFITLADGLRRYHTGDLGYYLPNGDVMCLGRIDGQVNVRGFRIETGEVAAHLRELPQVKSAVVVAKNALESITTQLIAYVVMENTEQCKMQNTAKISAELMQNLSLKIPLYMVPSQIVVLDSIPLTVNNKIDYQLLPDVIEDNKTFIKPTTDAEQTLSDIWSALLNVNQVGIEANFFTSGGHSLLAVKLVAAIRDAFHVEIPLRLIFESATLAELAREILAVNHGNIREKIIATHDNAQPAPLAFSQERLWFIDQLNMGRTQYNMPLALHVVGKFDVEIANTVMKEIVTRHQVLRTVYQQGEQSSVQTVCHEFNFSVNKHDVSQLASKQKSSAIMKLMEEDQRLEFNLREDLMVRASYITTKHGIGEEGVLLFNMHHIASDGWSIGILINEFTTRYQAIQNNQPNPFTPLAIQYADYAIWQKKWLAENILEKQLTYWKKQLADIPTLHQLPLDNPRPAEKNNEGALVVGNLPLVMSEKISKFSKVHQLTPFMFMHAALAFILAKNSNQHDIVIGTPVANRLQSELEPLIGFFVNNLVLRSAHHFTELSDYLAHIREVNLMAQSHQDVPFEQLVDTCKTERSLNYTPLFQISFSMNTNEVIEQKIDGLSFTTMESNTHHVKFDLDVSAQFSNKGLTLHWLYDTAIFNKASIEKLNDQLLRLITNMVKGHSNEMSSTDKTISPSNTLNIDFLSKENIQQQLVDWNDTQVSYPVNNCIHQLFEAQAEQHPNNIAVVFKESSLTYRALNEQANQLAAYLIAERNITPDTLVGLCVERSLDMIIGIFAILKAGGAYVPLDPDYPQARLAYMIDDAQLNSILTTRSVMIITPIDVEKAVCLDDKVTQNTLATYPTENFTNAQLTPQHLAYVIYTSGSTGQPKGVMVEHQQSVNFIYSMKSLFDFKASDKLLAVTSISFDVHTSEVFLPLVSAGQIIIAAQDNTSSPSDLATLIKVHEITFMQATPSTWSMLVMNGWQPRDHMKILSGGEAISSHLKNNLLANEQGLLWNMYGPTETCVYSLWQKLDIERGITIGQAVDNTEVCVLDENNQLLPQGVAGELHIGGAGLARGYLNQEELTAERFIANPFYDEAKTKGVPTSPRLYKTGDLVRWQPDGMLEYLGRIDHQVKIRGFRIELGEIEHQLVHQDSVNDAIVLAKTNEQGVKQLIAYVATTLANSFKDETVQAQQTRADYIECLQETLQSTLPNYMVPTAFVLLENFPLTSNGKLDKKALPDADTASQQKIYVAPTTYTEKALCEIWQDVLAVENVGITDNFFALGGHSLLIMIIITKLQKKNIYSKVRDFFANPNISDLAYEIDNTNSEPHEQFHVPENLITLSSKNITPEMLPLVQLNQSEIDNICQNVPGGVSNIQDIYPLAPLQEGILFHHILDPRTDPYVIGNLLKVTNKSNLDRFINCLEFVIARHDVLRTAFFWNELKSPVQVVCKNVCLPVHHHEFEIINETNLLDTIIEKSKGLAAVIDINKAPLLRLDVVQSESCDHLYVALRFHHIISDHVGLEIITRELNALSLGETHLLTTPLPYRNFIAHTKHQEKHTDADRFFKDMLGDIEEPCMPFSLSNTHDKELVIEEVREIIPDHCSVKLRDISRDLKISPAVIFHAAWSIVIANCSNQNDVVFGTVVSGRLQGLANVENTMGLFINTLPLRFKLVDQTALSLLRQTEQQLTDLIPLEQISLSRALSFSGLSKEVPLFNNIFNYRHSKAAQDSTSSESNHYSTTGVEFLKGQEQSNYPLDLSVDDLGEGFTLTVQVVTAIGGHRVIGYMKEALEQLVDCLIQAPETKITSLSILPEDENNQQLIQWNETPQTYLDNLCIHQLFEVQAKKAPDNIAVVFEGQSLTYKALNEQSNQLAAYLKAERGITADTLVGLCVERSLEVVIGILAILKAGGAYVPLDPNYPAARLAYMIEDAKLDTILTTKAVLSNAPISQKQIICLDDELFKNTLQAYSIENIKDGLLTPQHLAYVIYTSGSTGQPKGVMVEHGALSSHILHMSDELEIKSNDRFLQMVSFSFDTFVEQFFASLSNGSTTYVVPDVLMTATDFFACIDQYQITVTDLSPAYLGAFLTESLASHWAKSTVNRIVVGGEALSPSVLNDWFRFGNSHSCKIFNAYGPTEAVITSTLRELRLSDCDELTIGKKVGNKKLYVLNEQQQPCPIGCIGELYIGGSLARGYLNKPEQTAQVFSKFSLTNSEPVRLYRSGDFVKYLPDGRLVFIGRTDEQIKIRGFRVEAAEIEGQLTRQENINDAIVLGKTNQQGEQQLVAYITSPLAERFSLLEVDNTDVNVNNSERSLFVNSLRQSLSNSLPDYMVPKAFVILEKFPLTPNGKVDRKLLLDIDIISQQQSYIAPKTIIEKELCDIWQEVLGIEQVGLTDNFFSLGGHSLLATRLTYEINKRLSSQLSVRNIFEYPVLGQLSASLVLLSEETGDEKYILCNNTFDESIPTFFLLPPVAGEWGDVTALEEAAKQRFNLVLVQQYCADMSSKQSVCDYFIKQIETFSIDGPIIIGGYSQGGVWAYEVAKQLLLSGVDISQVVILDSLAPGNFDNLADDEITEIVDSQLRRANIPIERELSLSFGTLMVDLQRSLPSMPEDYINQLVERINFAARNTQLSSAVAFDKSIQLPLVYFLTNETTGLDKKLEVWQENNDLMRVIEVPVDHNNMLTSPYVDTLFTHIIDNI